MNRDVLKAFFADYAARANRALQDHPEIDVDAAVAAFTECFVEAHPGGVMCFQNNARFHAAVPQLFESQRGLGARSMTIDQLELTELNEQHHMANVQWRVVYKLNEGRQISAVFDEIYFVQIRDGLPRIFAYIAGDQDKLLRDLGILGTAS